MSAYIACISSVSGLPIFSRKKGNVESLPFSIIGSLSGVHMFAKSQHIELLNTLTEDYCVAWKEYEENLLMIGISTGCSKDILTKLLDSVFNLFVLIVGLDEIKSQRNVEFLKREFKIGLPLVDRLIESLDYGASNNKYNSDIVGLAECILCAENHLLQILLDTYTEFVDSMFSCVLIHGKIAMATENWWTLHSEEIKLLSILASTESTTNAKDIPVFLPYKSPTQAFRFISFSITPEVQICSLCGPTPKTDEIEHSALQCFKSSTEILNAAVQTYPRNFPFSCEVDPLIMGLLLINTTYGKYMFSRSPQQQIGKKTASSAHRLDILRTFYYQSVLPFFSDNESIDINETESLNDSKKEKNKSKSVAIDTTLAQEIYWCSEYHKCHALVIEENILCVLYNSSIPSNAMKLVTEKTLKSLINDKQIGW